MPKEFCKYLISYRHQDADWSLTIVARSPQDALDRIRQLYYNGTVDGELMMTIPAFAPGLGILARVLCWWKNLVRSRSGNRNKRVHSA